MATENKRLNVNPILWSTADTTFVPASGEIWYYYETAGSILSVVGDGSSTVQELRDGAYINQVDNLGLSPNRTAFKGLTSGILSTSGWYTIAESSGTTTDMAMGDITAISSGARGASAKFGIRGRASSRDSSNTFIQITNYASTVTGLTDDVSGFRLAKSDTTEAAGFKLQMKIDSSDAYNIMLSNHISYTDKSGIQLVTPYLDDTPTLPDGVTTATFIEAGAELASIGGIAFTDTRFVAYSASAAVLRVALYFDEIPKQAATVTFPVGFDFYTPEKTLVYSVTANENIPVYNIAGNVVTASITTTGLTSGLIGFGRGASFSAVLS